MSVASKQFETTITYLDATREAIADIQNQTFQKNKNNDLTEKGVHNDNYTYKKHPNRFAKWTDDERGNIG